MTRTLLTAIVSAIALSLAPNVAAQDKPTAEATEPALEKQTFMIEGGGGLPIAVTTGGNPDGPALLFVHSLMGSTMNWEKQFSSSLAQTHHLISLDIRGHGSSAKPMAASAYTSTQMHADDIAAVIAATGIEKPVLVTWAYGALNALDYIRHYGDEDISGLVIIEGNGGFEKIPTLPDTEEYRNRIARSQALDLATIRDWTWEFGDYLMRSEPLPPAEAEIIRTSSMMVPHWVRAAMRDHPADNTDMIDKVTVPVLLVTTIDEGPSMEMMTRIAGKLPDAEIAIVPTGGSLSFWYRPEAFAEIIQEFAQ